MSFFLVFRVRSNPFAKALRACSGILSSRTETEGPVRREISEGSSAWNDGVLRIVLRVVLEFVS